MISIRETLQRVVLALRDAGSSSPRLDADLLLAFVLNCDRTQLLAQLPEPFLPRHESALADVLARRIAGEPIAYILGTREFFGLDLIVTPAVLMPRPETELLVEWALPWLSAKPNARVVDIGTGSGAIALALATNTPTSVSILATDISTDALAVAQRNAERHAPGRIEFRSGFLADSLEFPIDLLIANLPYLRPDQIDGQREISFEPRLALDGGLNGLDLIERLIDQSRQLLSPGGAIALEIDPGQAETVSNLLTNAWPDAVIEVHRDLAGLQRFVTAIRI